MSRDDLKLVEDPDSGDTDEREGDLLGSVLILFGNEDEDESSGDSAA